MSVAPELPPAFVPRRRPVLRAVPVDRTPAGVVALVEPARRRSPEVAAPGVLPAAVVRPSLDWDDVRFGGAEPAVRRVVEPVVPAGLEPAVGTGREHRPAGPVPIRAAGARVVRPARPGLRLTVRGRLVAGAAVLVAGVLMLVLAAGRLGSLDDSAPVPASAPSQVVVAPGETLWTIAERVAPEQDPRTVVDRIRRLNDLPTSDVQAGQTLLLRAP